MAVKIKNKLYQPVAITDDAGVITMLKSREKRIINNLNIDNLPAPVKGLERKKLIKIKEV